MPRRLRSTLIAYSVAAACLGSAIVGVNLAGNLAPRAVAADTGTATTSQIPPNSVTVSAGGDIQVAPDMATVTFGVLVNRDNAQDAQTAANAVIADAVKNLHALGLPNRQIQTAEITLQPRYDNSGNVIIGYQASQTLAVTVYDLKLTGRVVDAGVSAKANNNVSISYGLRNDNTARSAALKLATQMASVRAQAAASALGRSLVGAHVQITETNAIAPRPVVDSFSKSAAPSNGVATPATQGYSGLLTVHEDVTLTYTF